MEMVRFLSTISGVEEIMPIIKSSELKHEWKIRASKDISKCPVGQVMRNVSRCPGINALHKTGWIVRLWQDVTITADEEGDDISWTAPVDDTSIAPIISFHDKDVFHKYRSDWPKNTSKHILKFNTGWRAIIPKGYKLLQLPVMMSDETNFTPVEGVYDIGDQAGLAIPVYWHNVGTKVLKAGTPLAQLILIPDEEYEFTVEGDTSETEKEFNIQNMLYSNTLFRNYNKIRKFWRNRK